MDSALAALLNQASAYLNAGVVRGPAGQPPPEHRALRDLRAPPTATSPSRCGNDALFARLCAALGRAGARGRRALRDERAAASSTATTLGGRARGRASRQRRAAEWVARLGAAGVPAGEINDVAQAFAFAEALGLEPVDETDGVRTVRSPLRLGDTPAARARPPAAARRARRRAPRLARAATRPAAQRAHAVVPGAPATASQLACGRQRAAPAGAARGSRRRARCAALLGRDARRRPRGCGPTASPAIAVRDRSWPCRRRPPPSRWRQASGGRRTASSPSPRRSSRPRRCAWAPRATRSLAWRAGTKDTSALCPLP